MFQHEKTVSAVGALPRLHFLGIGGVGMAGVAFLLKRRGYAVSGCDRYQSPRTRWLEKSGIIVGTGHSPAHLADIDELIVTPAVQPAEPELAEARAKGLRIRRRGEVLADIVNATDGIAVCGTHGKTTTATFTAKLLHLLGDDPGWCIGGECGDMPVAAAGTGPLVVEADESDGTLALYRAKILVVTTMDYDHPEHFKTLEDYRACFAQAEAQAGDVIHAWEIDASDWPELESLVLGRHNVMNARAAIEVAIRRGYSRDQIAAVLPQALSTLPDRRFQTIWPIATSDALKADNDSIETVTKGINLHAEARRCGGCKKASVTVITDYAHHPAELACAVNMAAELHPKRLRVLFQPHRYSRTKALKDEFPTAFTAADEVVLIPVYPAFEKPILGGDIADLYVSFRKLQMRNDLWPQGLRLARSPEEAWKHVFLTRKPGDLIILAGAGDIINLAPRILSDMGTVPEKTKITPINLSKLSFYKTGGVSYGGGKPFYLGMGSNTWFSDCATDIEIVQAPKTMGTVPEKTMGTVPVETVPVETMGTVPTGLMGTVPAGLPGAQLLAFHPELAFMAGIPGTVGGWTKMNAGAFGDSFGNHLASVTLQDENGHTKTISAENCGFSYRHSNITDLIVSVTLKNMGTVPTVTGTVPMYPPGKNTGTVPTVTGTVPKNTGSAPTYPSSQSYLARRKKFPPRTCGSVFKNPSSDMPAGRLLEEVGAKQFRVGGAHVWQEHANVIVAGEGATSSDILALARLMAAAVRHRFGIALEPEVCGLGL